MVPPPARPGVGVAPPGPASSSSSSSQRIDPAQIPRPPHDDHADVVKHDTRTTHGTATHPPSANTTFIARDAGCCNPRYMRSTMSTIPNTSELLASSGMPLTIVVQPLALPHAEEAPIQVVDNGECGPVRCGRCKAYMNPFMRWLDHSRFACNFCGFAGECPREYGCALGADGRRSDWSERPELCKGSVEYVAPPEYMVRAPMSPALFFCVDVSPRAVETGATTSAIEAIARTLDTVPNPDRTLVGLCTFDAAAHFYHIAQGGASGAPRMLVVPDVDEPYAPVPDGLAVPLGPNRDAIDGVLKQLPKMFCDPMENGRRGAPCGAAAVKACVEALKPIGGRVLAFIASLPTGGMGALKPRGPVNQGSTAGGGGGGGGGFNNESDKDAAKYLAPGDKCYMKLAVEAAEYKVAIDLFLLTNGYVDVASLGVLPRVTGGSLYRYPNFNTTLDFAQLHNDLRWNVLRCVLHSGSHTTPSAW